MSTPKRPPGAQTPSRWLALVSRAMLLFGLWLVIDQSAAPGNLVVGGLATAGATWVSLHLLPPESGRIRVSLLLLLLPRFLWQSLVAGLDVARRALSPRMPLASGFVACPVTLPRGPARNAFKVISSLLPGSAPTDEGERSVEYHALDTGQPVAEQLAAEERVYARALIPGTPRG